MRRRGMTVAITAVTVVSAMAVTGAQSVWDGVYSETQATRGEAIYRRSCALCHGPTLDGTESAPELRGRSLFAPYYGKSLAVLVTSVREKMPKDDPGTLTAQQAADVVAYVLRVNRMPAGPGELSAASDTLGGIRIEPKPQ